MTTNKKLLKDYEISILIDIACHGRPYSPQEVWQWMDLEDIESLRHGEITVFEFMPALDSLQERGAALPPSDTHSLELPPPQFPEFSAEKIGGQPKTIISDSLLEERDSSELF